MNLSFARTQSSFATSTRDLSDLVIEDNTVCLRFRVFYFRQVSSLVSARRPTRTGLDISLSIYACISHLSAVIYLQVLFKTIRQRIGKFSKFFDLPRDLETWRWYHFCGTYMSLSSELVLYLDGQEVIREEEVEAGRVDVQHLLLGLGVNMGSSYAFSGQITQANFWSRALSEKQVRELSDCTLDLGGDLVSWEGEWNLTEVTVENIPNSKVCDKDEDNTTYILLALQSFPSAASTCKAMGGYIPAPTTVPASWTLALTLLPSQPGIMSTHDLIKPYSDRCNGGRLFVGGTDEAKEDEWRDAFTGELLAFPEREDPFWGSGEPNGWRFQNCLTTLGVYVSDTQCLRESCSVCRIPSHQVWTLRGICEEETRHYYFTSSKVGLNATAFQGYTGYVIDAANELWVFRDEIKGVVMATLNATENEHPVGRRLWNFEQPQCDQDPGPRYLSLISCRDGQFACDDGSCIAMRLRCDMKYDCRDKSDEVRCAIVEFGPQYEQTLPARSPVNPSGVLLLSADVLIETINIISTDMIMDASFVLELSWLDSRVTYQNLKATTSLNLIPWHLAQKLWAPTILFTNTDGNMRTVVDIDSTLYVDRGSGAFQTDLTRPDVVELYPGSSTILSMSRKYSIQFKCHFDLTLYPFDSQHCYMKLRVSGSTSDYIGFNRNSTARYNGSELLMEYSVGETTLSVDNKEEFAALKVKLELIRRSGYAILNIYTPSLTLIIISYVTLFFRADMFEVRVMSALTALLVLATIFTQFLFLPSTPSSHPYFPYIFRELFILLSSNFLIFLSLCPIDIPRLLFYAF
ncbi:putative glutamate-gated chloride channel isoform X1 [Penaeus vannamei]|uniref:Putative glutamate-gated chloride channel isoform X1 n=1 Tax=Penaeus vannamei TaxID=6689 RepID=A0A423SSK7_PENVA|nr:putative glutamate-gated chloride channel isoform X1 [Penaeus vannamei]